MRASAPRLHHPNDLQLPGLRGLACVAVVSYAGVMSYPDGGGLTAADRARRWDGDGLQVRGSPQPARHQLASVASGLAGTGNGQASNGEAGAACSRSSPDVGHPHRRGDHAGPARQQPGRRHLLVDVARGLLKAAVFVPLRFHGGHAQTSKATRGSGPSGRLQNLTWATIRSQSVLEAARYPGAHERKPNQVRWPSSPL